MNESYKFKNARYFNIKHEKFEKKIRLSRRDKSISVSDKSHTISKIELKILFIKLIGS
jgi:hypothetical protein